LKVHSDSTLDGCFVVYGLKVIRHAHGYLVAMPQRKWRNGGHYTIGYATTAEARGMIDGAVMAEYCKVVAEAASQTPNNRA
jgi:DNA-binding cell septation regulator SpoVG